MYRSLSTSLWASNIGCFNPILSKGPVTTTWIWNLHASPHDFYADVSAGTAATYRKIFSVGISHIGVVLFWISGMLFHGAYFSNYTDWLRDPIHVKPSSHFVTDIVGQDIINADVGGYFSGLPIASGLFQIWRTHGMVSVSHLKLASFATMLFCLALITLGYVIMHLQPIRSYSRIVSIRSALAIAGLSSLTWSGHILHISIPTNTLLSSGVDPSYIPSPEDLLSRDVARSILPAFGKSSFLLGTSLRDYYMGSYSDASGSASMYIALLHHVYLGIALIISSMSLRQRADKWATLKIG